MIDYDHEKGCYVIPTQEDIITRLRQFLEVKKESSGGYSPVSKDEIDTLWDIVNDIIHNKYEMDPDGDVPVEIELTDRTKFERSHFFPLPYSHDVNTLEGLIDIAETAQYNLSSANEKFERSFRAIKWFMDQQKKAKK